MAAERIDVLAVMDRAAPIIGNSDHGDAYAVLTMLPEARAAVAELIEAGKELQAAQAHYDALDCPGGARWDRLVAARERHAAALARVQGEGA